MNNLPKTAERPGVELATSRRSRVARGSGSQNVAAWRSGDVVGRINEVTLRLARLVLGWVTVFGGQTTSVF